MTQAASASWDQLKLQTTAGLQDAFKTRKHFEIDVTLHSPYLVVPENGSYSRDSHLLVVDLGKLSLKGSSKDTRSLEEVSLHGICCTSNSRCKSFGLSNTYITPACIP